MRAGFGIALVAAGVGSASAAPAKLVVIDDACSSELFASRVAALSGRDPFADGPVAGVAPITVEIERTPRGVAARVRSGDDQRDLAAATCDELGDAVAVVVALAIRDLPAAVATSVEVPHAEARSVPVVRSIIHRSTSALELEAASSLGVSSVGLRSRIAIGGDLRRGPVSLGLDLSGDLPAALPVGAVGDGAHVTVEGASLSIAPCVHAGPIAACTLATVGVLRGAGTGLLESHPAAAKYVAVGGRLAVRRSLTRSTALELHIDVDAPITTTRFTVDQMLVWSTPRIEGWCGVGVVAHFP